MPGEEEARIRAPEPLSFPELIPRACGWIVFCCAVHSCLPPESITWLPGSHSQPEECFVLVNAKKEKSLRKSIRNSEWLGIPSWEVVWHVSFLKSHFVEQDYPHVKCHQLPSSGCIPAEHEASWGGGGVGAQPCEALCGQALPRPMFAPQASPKEGKFHWTQGHHVQYLNDSAPSPQTCIHHTPIADTSATR